MIRQVVTVACVLAINSVLAQESRPTADIELKTSQAEDSDSEVKKTNKNSATNQKPSTKVKAPSRFKPREEISEDFSVPFPVDI
ncbi:hypothetical protein A9Q90_06970 [Gammaproteobacteria bacterium 54_18_T64]|nr:hypothetical protein A9Q90_06970 [Gammaproteobacteria bacterium 54_18_T64]